MGDFIEADRTLQATLKYALLRIPFYRHLQISSLENPVLDEFPIIDAAIVADHLDLFYRLDRLPDFVLMTGGTTSSTSSSFFPLMRSEVERSYSQNAHAERQTIVRQARFAIQIADSQHGFVDAPSSPRPIVRMPLDCQRHIPVLMRMIYEGLVVDQIKIQPSEIHAPLPKLKILTDSLEQSHRHTESPIDTIVTYAFHMSQSWHRRIAASWRATVVNAYGLTEFSNGPMLQCRECDGYHLPQTVVGESLCPDRLVPVETGIAVLVLTSLYPYRSTMPLIRYNTRDVVEILHGCPKGSPSFRFCGRLGTVLYDNNHQYILGPADVLESIDELGLNLTHSPPFNTSFETNVHVFPTLHLSVHDGLFRLILEVCDESECEMAHSLTQSLIRKGLARSPDGVAPKVRVDLTTAGGLKQRGVRPTLF